MMTYDIFKQKLNDCDLSVKEFAFMCGLNPRSISTTWKSKNEVPQWVKPFIENYIKAKTLESVKDVICDNSYKR